jgi:hypothetical protein
MLRRVYKPSGNTCINFFSGMATRRITSYSQRRRLRPIFGRRRQQRTSQNHRLHVGRLQRRLSHKPQLRKQLNAIAQRL